MSRYIQFHILTSYPPANLNRDDMGRPKTAKMGGVTRLRVSSQSLKRAWRTSDLFFKKISNESLDIFGRSIKAGIGIRSRKIGSDLFEKYFTNAGLIENDAKLWARDLCFTLGAVDGESADLSQLVHVSDEEISKSYKICEQIVGYLLHQKEEPLFDKIKELQGKRLKKKKVDDIKKIDSNIGAMFREKLLNYSKTSVDIALFGRMLASSPQYSVEASCQVAHSISVHGITIEDDYFTAVDDLNDHSDDAGAAHLGETGFASALFYSYVCLNKDLLHENLGGDEALTKKVLNALTEAMLKVSPEGKQNSFASRAYASFVKVEKGSQQPRSLSVAFLKPIEGNDFGNSAILSLENQLGNMDQVYGKCAEQRYTINALEGEGSMEELLNFVTE